MRHADLDFPPVVHTRLNMAVSSPSRLALRGDLLDCTAAPGWGDTASDAVRFRPDHWLLVEGGRIVGAQPAAEPLDPSWSVADHRGHLILPGFIDTHVHSPQLDVIASHGTALLDWLDTYTFPAERRYADPAEAEAGAARFLDALIAHGTTSAVVFAPSTRSAPTSSSKRRRRAACA